MGYFKLYQSEKNQEWYFNLKAGNHEIILQSQGYKAKTSAVNGINSVKANSQSDDRFIRKVAKNGNHYFSLNATNGQSIGRREMYRSTSGMENGIASVKKNAFNAEIKA